MKTKHFHVIVAVLCIARPALAQGLVNFGNRSVAGRVSTNSTYSGPSTGLINGPADSYYFALLVAPTNQATVTYDFSGWTFTGNYGTNVPTRAGTFNGDYTTDPGVIVPNWPIGTNANFVAVGWSANLGTSWDQVLQLWLNPPTGPPPYAFGWFGFSDVNAQVVIGGASTPISTVPLQSFTLGLIDIPIPEPSPIALLAVGAILGCRFRRKRLL